MHGLDVSRSEYPDDIAELLDAAEREGFRFIRRLADDWASGPREAFFVARVDGRLAGVCGVNVDPYAGSPDIARLRHLYVLPGFRRGGIGRALTNVAIEFAFNAGYRVIRLRTDTAEAAAFYERCGFTRVHGDAACTHELRTTANAATASASSA